MIIERRKLLLQKKVVTFDIALFLIKIAIIVSICIGRELHKCFKFQIHEGTIITVLVFFFIVITEDTLSAEKRS